MAETGTNSLVGEVLLELDRTSPVSMHAQVEALVREAIRGGRLPSGSALPPSRRLAQELGLSRGVVVEAYQQLAAEGYLVSQSGSFTRVAEGVTAPLPAQIEASGSGREVIDFRYGRPDVTHFPRNAWLRSLRRALLESPHDRFTYLDGRGAPELHHALAEYLNRVRSTWATPDTIVACNGFAQAISLICSVLAAGGATTFAVEDPSDDHVRRAITEAGLRIVGIPVEGDGIDVAALEASGADAVLLTPAHQFPTGGVLSPAKRAAVVAWATRTGAIVVEDDYDAEYRYGSAPVGAIQGLAPDRVIYAGTASKTLAPGLRMGWMIVPPHLVGAITRRKHEVDRGSPVIEQLALADFVRRGELDRHLRRMRPIYRARRDALIAALESRLPQLRLVGIAGGIHALAWLPPDLDEESVVRAARERSLIIDSLASSRIAPSRGGLLFGWGTLDEAGVRHGVDVLAGVVADLG